LQVPPGVSWPLLHEAAPHEVPAVTYAQVPLAAPVSAMEHALHVPVHADPLAPPPAVASAAASEPVSAPLLEPESVPLLVPLQTYTGCWVGSNPPSAAMPTSIRSPPAAQFVPGGS
jgi:hypothetical protein